MYFKRLIFMTLLSGCIACSGSVWAHGRYRAGHWSGPGWAPAATGAVAGVPCARRRAHWPAPPSALPLRRPAPVSAVRWAASGPHRLAVPWPLGSACAFYVRWGVRRPPPVR